MTKHAAKKVELTEAQIAELKAEEAKWARDYAVKSANEWFDQITYILQHRLDEIASYKDQFNEAVNMNDNMCKPTDVLSWAVNDCMHITSNLRIDMAVTIASRCRDGGLK